MRYLGLVTDGYSSRGRLFARRNLINLEDFPAFASKAMAPDLRYLARFVRWFGRLH